MAQFPCFKGHQRGRRTIAARPCARENRRILRLRPSAKRFSLPERGEKIPAILGKAASVMNESDVYVNKRRRILRLSRAYIGGGDGMFEQLILFFLRDALFLLGYLTRGNAFPKPLEREEEARMIERMQQGDQRARETLIEHNLRLAAHIARKYTVPGYDSDDLISIGTVGLIKGVNTFKPGTGTQLSTYCARCIENPMLPPA